MPEKDIWIEVSADPLIDDQGKPSSTVHIIRDITERRTAAEALRQSETLLNTAQRLTKVGGWEWDVAQQTMFWTDETYRIHEIDPNAIEPGSSEHIERSLECYDEKDRPVILEAFQKCASEGKSYDMEFPLNTVKGQRIWIRTTAKAVKENGEVARVIGNIMDITMPNLNGIEATRFIRQANPNVRIVALSAHFDKHFVLEMLRAGASGYVLKSYLFDEVLRALRAVNADQHYLSPKITEIVLDDYIPFISKAKESHGERLTARERQVVQLLAEGKSTKQIALCLHVSPKTVDSNRRQIMSKLRISSVAGLTKYAIREGLTSAEF